MVLTHSPTPEFLACKKKAFMPNEEHVTRIYDRCVLILMTSGTLRFLENGKEITLTPGEYYIQRHRLLQEGLPLDDPPVYYYIEFFGSFSETAAGLSLRGVYDATRILRHVQRLSEEADRKDRNPFFLAALMNRIFGELTGNTHSGNSTVTQIKDYIESEYSTEITLSLLAKKFGYTEDYISRLFQKELGITPHKYLINIRLEQAMWLLESTDLSAERISAAVGYGDFSAFWRAFNAKYKFSPGTVRKHRPNSSQAL